MKALTLFVCIALLITSLFLRLEKNNGIQSIVDNISETTVCINNEVLTTELIEGYFPQKFPKIIKATLYRNGIPEELELTNQKLLKMVDYIMCSVEQNSFGYVTGVLPNSDIERYYKPEKGMYILLELDSQNSVEFNRYDCCVIFGNTVVIIDSDSTSYLGEGNPFNKCIVPYLRDYDIINNCSPPDILEVCEIQ